MKPLNAAERRLAAVTADVIATAEDMGLPDAASGLASKHAIQLLAHSFIEQRSQIRALHDLVDQLMSMPCGKTDPNDPVGTAVHQGRTREATMKRCKLKMTVVVTYDAEFEDTLAASEMIKSLERDPYPGTALGVTTERWRVRLAKKNHSVEVVNDEVVNDEVP